MPTLPYRTALLLFFIFFYSHARVRRRCGATCDVRRAQAQALKHSSAMRDAGQAKKSELERADQSPQKVLVDIDSRTGDAA